MDEHKISPELFAELHSLSSASLSGQIAPEQSRRLEALLSDAASQKLYLELIFEASTLLVWADFPRSHAGDVATISEPAPAAPELAPPPLASSSAKSPVLGFLGSAIDYVNHSRMLMFWTVALLVGGWFAFQLGSLMIGRAHPGGAPVAGQPAGANSSDVSTPPGGSFADTASPRRLDPVAPTTVAWITAVVDGHWRVVPPAAPPALSPASAVNDTGADTSAGKREPFHVGSEFSAGQQLDLIHGLAEITFRSGARIVLNGPVHFTVGSPLGGALQIGKLTARVPHDARGFTIDSPAGKVVDLGTEFGVSVGPDHTMEVEVFAGEVSVSSAPIGSSLGSTDRLAAGHAARIAAGEPVISIPPKPNRFIVGLGPRENPAKARDVYVKWMRSLNPAVWFRMEGKAGERVLHDEMGDADAKLAWDGAGNPFLEGRVGKCLWLRGPKVHDYAILPKYAQAEHSRLSVTAWAYADSFPQERFCAACNWINGDGRGQFFLGLRGIGGKGAALFAYITDWNGRVVDLNEPDARLFPLYEWQHIALTTDGSMLRLYRQGREVAAIKHTGLQYPVRQEALAIGVRPNDGASAPASYPSYWDGKLDEVAIFNQTLTADEIREMASAPP